MNQISAKLREQRRKWAAAHRKKYPEAHRARVRASRVKAIAYLTDGLS